MAVDGTCGLSNRQMARNSRLGKKPNCHEGREGGGVFPLRQPQTLSFNVFVSDNRSLIVLIQSYHSTHGVCEEDKKNKMCRFPPPPSVRCRQRREEKKSSSVIQFYTGVRCFLMRSTQLLPAHREITEDAPER